MSRPAGRRRPPSLLTVLLLGLGAALLLLVLNHESGSVLGMTTHDFSRLSLLLAVLIFVGAGVMVRAMRPGEIFHAIAFWFMAIVLLVAAYAFRDDLAMIGGRVLGALAPGTPVAGRLSGEADPNTVVITRSADGHFGVRAVIDGHATSLLVDTGASFVTLTPRDATAIGIDTQALAYTLPVRTANGVIETAPIRIASIAIGPIERRDVPALVTPAGALEQSLLGMSFLDRLDSYSVSGDRLILNP